MSIAPDASDVADQPTKFQNWQQLVQHNDEVIAQFLRELTKGTTRTEEEIAEEGDSETGSNGEKEWIPCAGNDTTQVSYQKDEATGTYRLKVVGRIPFPPSVVETVMFDNALRKSWDHDLTEILVVDKFPNGDCALQIKLRTPPPVMKRDSIHIRTHMRFEEPITYTLNGDLKPPKTVLVVDSSPPNSEEYVPVEKGFVRAFTYFTGGLIEPVLLSPKSKRKQQEAKSSNRTNSANDVEDTDDGANWGSLFSSVVHVDPKGYIPQWVLRMTATRSSLFWFARLIKGCEKYVKGQLEPKN